MFKIYGDATEFDQWAMDYALTNEHMAVGDKVLFRNASGEVCPMYAYDDGGVVVNVPNHLLQQARPIVVDLEGHPACRTTFNVIPHDKPEGYDDIYTEAETHAPGDIESRVKALEVGGGSSGGGMFVIEMTVNSDFTAVTVNKTFAEIDAAYRAGLWPVVYWPVNEVFLYMNMSPSLEFGCVGFAGDALVDDHIIHTEMVIDTNSDVWWNEYSIECTNVKSLEPLPDGGK